MPLTYSGVSVDAGDSGTGLNYKPSSSSSSDDSSNILQTILGNSGQTLNGAAQIINAIKGYQVPAYTNYTGGATAPAQPTIGSSNTVWIVVIIVVVLVMAFFMMRKK